MRSPFIYYALLPTSFFNESRRTFIQSLDGCYCMHQFYDGIFLKGERFPSFQLRLTLSVGSWK